MHLCDASGASMDPMFMFKGNRFDATAIPNAPNASVIQYQSSAYFRSVHLIEVLRHIFRTISFQQDAERRKL